MQNRRLISLLVGLFLLVGGLLYANMVPTRSVSVTTPATTQTPAAAVLAASEDASSTASTTSIASLPPNTYMVDRVVDGDTIVLNMHGVAEKIRLIGLDTPEVVDSKKPVQCFGPEASAEAKKLLVGQAVRFEADPTQGTYDVYHRRLGYVFLSSGTNFEEYMIAQGFGREYTYKRPYKYQKEFKAAQVEAKAAGLGLWSACGA